MTGKLSAAESFRRSDCRCDSINPLPESERDGAHQIRRKKKREKKTTQGTEKASYQLIGKKTSRFCNGEPWGVVVRLPCNEIAREPRLGFEIACSFFAAQERGG